jgi:hypothetical protein
MYSFIHYIYSLLLSFLTVVLVFILVHICTINIIFCFRIDDCCCGSGRSYLNCCKILHSTYTSVHTNNSKYNGSTTPEAMLRARFSAYKLGVPQFIIGKYGSSNACVYMWLIEFVIIYGECRHVGTRLQGLRVLYGRGIQKWSCQMEEANLWTFQYLCVLRIKCHRNDLG